MSDVLDLIDELPDSVKDRVLVEALRSFATDLGRQRAAELKAGLGPQEEIAVLRDSDILSRPKPEWWVEGLIQENTIALLAGEAGIGKSFLMLHIARCIASGTQFFHRSVKAGKVLYVVAEGASSFGSRVRAWDDFHATTVPSGNLAYVEAGVNLSSEESMERFMAVLKAEESDLIILDTLSQLSAVDNENDAAQLAVVFRMAKRLRDIRPGSTVLIVHHVNKGEGKVRGSSVIRSNADTVIVARKSGNGFKLTTDVSHDGKQKDGASVTIDGFELASHLDSAVVTLKGPAVIIDPDWDIVRDVMSDGNAHSKTELRIASGHPKADGSDAAYKAWDRKFKRWVDQDALVLDGTDYRILDVAR